MTQSTKLSYGKVVILGFLVYFFSYSMRLDYAASLVAIVNDLGVTNTAASAAITGSFITYGVGQMAFGFVGDKLHPVKIITFAMLGTILVNILVSFCTSITLISVLWCFNGVFQAMIWPPLCRFVAEQTTSAQYSSAITTVGISGSVGTIFVYLFVPAVLSITAWVNVFRCMALFGAVIVTVWGVMTRSVSFEKPKPASTANGKNEHSIFKIIALAGLVPIFFIIVLQGILRDGIQTWLPSMVSADFNMDESSSILSTAVLPLLSMVSVLLSNYIYIRLKNEIKTATIMFSIAAVATIPLGLGLKIPALLSIFLAALISGCMHGVNHMIVSLIPKRFHKYGLMSTFSGILNSFTYVGAALSTYVFAAASDHLGWGIVKIIWLVIGLSGALICLFKLPRWTKFIETK
ncbi:MAG: MFS transporter [Clostridia bacterium]|nr:MFS transporter [Clostridia bacterium]